ncbi:proline dehydrogenase [Trypanosoma equiperdum]|uniref:Proline dehydrogenase n=2 Tax=Trypanozoon TaxID=39700 RepID=Q57U33_TRYB2|nr:proline oxidase, putative [Trypanosoma brucei brucei TREU927]AAX70885.1 proline oxidase, putative [Trypanosoma brucei]AAZ12086.1 proline oxidase, putative [Trypanosoma brucei brucei TREU927]SCU66762.1 proline dehydrogenase [Trypanosoma equiperdum]
MFRLLCRRSAANVKMQDASLRTMTKVDFSDPSIFRQKSLWWLLRALFVLRICKFEFISNNSVALMKRAEAIFGPFLTYNTLVKGTVYGHFCAGESDREVKNTVKSLENLGIGSVLDYAAEAEAEGFAPSPGIAEAPNLSMASLVNNTSVTYLPHKQAFDENMKLYVMCVLHAALHKPEGGVGLAAVKVTGMCDPQLLARVSAILHSVHRDWIEYFTEEQPPPVEECNVVMGTKTEHKRYITRDQVRKGLTKLASSQKYTEDEINAVLQVLDPNNEGKTNYYKFKTVVSEAVLALDPTPVQKIIIDKLPKLTTEERELWRHLHWRLSVIVRTAKDLRVRVLFDAEQTFYQLAIDNIVLQFQRQFNKKEAIVYNTYQCYLTYTEDRVFNDLTRAELEGWVWGGKIVRGAYMRQERETAEKYHYKSPIWPTYEETNACYKAVAERILREIARLPETRFEALFGTHNQKSLEEITEAVLQLPPVKGYVAFAQLYGMSDNLTIPLKRAGFPVFKYVPYGPVKETVHYLGRRAMENASILSNGGSREVRLMRKELRRRVFWM